MQELNAVVFYVVIFIPIQSLLASIFLTPVLVRHSARKYHMMRRPGYDNVIFQFVSIDGKFYIQF